MFSIDFTRPWLYDEVIFFNQGNLATNNILRCSVVLDGHRDLKNCNGSVTFRTASGVEVVSSCKVVDPQKNIIEIKFPSNALEVGVNSLEILIVKTEDNVKVTTPSPIIKYEVWQCLTTDNGVAGDSKYPVLVDLIGEFSKAMSNLSNLGNKVDNAISKANNVITEANKSIFNANSATSKALDAVDLVNVSLASGTKDLEVKSARRDLNGVDHDNLSLRIASDFKGLKEAQDMAYSSDGILNYNGSITCEETKNGTVKDLKVSGKSLINLWSLNSVEKKSSNITIDNGYIKTVANGTYLIPSSKNIDTVKPSTYYTVIFDVSKNTCNGEILLNAEWNDESCFSEYKAIRGGEAGVFVYKMQSKPVLTSSKFLVRTQVQANCTSGEFVYRCIVVEGDYTQNPPNGYFEGVVSVGSGIEEIKVLSRKEDGNIFDKAQSVSISRGEWSYDGEKFFIDSRQDYLSNWYHIRVEPNTKYFVSAELDAWVRFYKGRVDSHGDGTTHLGSIEANKTSNTITTDESGWLTVRLTCETKQGKSFIKNIMISKENKPYEDYKSDKKTILFKDADGTWKPIKELRGLDVVCDTVELHNDGKYYYHARMAQGVLDENISIARDHVQVNANSCRIAINVDAKGKYLGSRNIANVIADKAVATSHDGWANTDKSNVIAINSDGGILLRTPKTFGETAQAIKESLRNNAINFIYQLAEEKVFEVNPLFLEAFEGETMVLINSGTINAPIELKLTSSLPNLTRNLQLRVDNLENEIYKSQELQNIMLLENDLRIMDLEFALMESVPMKLNLRSDVMFTKGVTEFEFLKGRILSGSHTDEYLEKCINKYKKAGRLTNEEYDILYDMIYPPVYDVLAGK